MIQIEFLTSQIDEQIEKTVRLFDHKCENETQVLKFFSDKDGVYISSSIIEKYGDEPCYFGLQLTENQYTNLLRELEKLRFVRQENRRLIIGDFTNILVNEKGFKRISSEKINDQTIETIFKKEYGSDTLKIRHFQRLHFEDVTDDFTVDDYFGEIASLKVPFSRQKLSQLLDIVLPF